MEVLEKLQKSINKEQSKSKIVSTKFNNNKSSKTKDNKTNTTNNNNNNIQFSRVEDFYNPGDNLLDVNCLQESLIFNKVIFTCNMGALSDVKVWPFSHLIEYSALSRSSKVKSPSYKV